MESSGDKEECRSSESGWTMYLGSPMEEDNGSTDGDAGNDEEEPEEELSDCDNVGSVHGEVEEEDRDLGKEDNDGNDSDDSMASDASSRPLYPDFLSKSNEKSKQVKGYVQGRGEVRKNLKMGKK